MRTEELLRHTATQRVRLGEVLAGLSPADWEHDTLCTGWTVKDVAAHAITHPQTRWRDVPGMLARNLGRSYDAMVFREVKRRSATRTPADVLAEFEQYATSPHHAPVTTSVEPVLDVLVHTQDIARPLGLTVEMPPDAAAVAADRARLLDVISAGWRRARRVRLVATDVDWVRGSGPTVEGPMQELLMICTGRPAYDDLLSGDGLELLRAR